MSIDDVLNHVDANLEQSLERLFSLLRIQSISTDPAYAKYCDEAASYLVKDFKTLGLKAKARETGGHKAVVAKGGAGKSVLFYGHYDVQPVDPLDLWETSPFEPKIVTREDGSKMIVARGACDDKGQIMTFIEAVRAWKAVTGELPFALTMLIEGEEENGSKNLFKFVKDNAEELKADIALVCDTGMWDSDTPAITTMLRGLVYEEVKVTCSNRDLHSGLYGGASANPIQVLAKAISKLKDKKGRVKLKGFYDGVKDLPKDVYKEWKSLDITVANFLEPIGLKKPVGEKGRLLMEMISSRPTCDVNGIWGGYMGVGTKTVIPSEASAKISFRLVEGQDPAKIIASFHKFMRKHIPSDAKIEFISYKGSPSISLPFDMPELTKAREALSEEWGVKTQVIGSGGSIPIVGDFKRVLGMNTLLIGFGLEDDRVHSPNEKYDMKSFHKGIRSWVRVFEALRG
jgi:acetylornithine deacetylase/succinyl-diaminopimelate desuccinylase-like protein